MRKAFAFVASLLAVSEMASAATLRPRDYAPDFKNVKAVSGKEFVDVSLKDYKGQYTVLLFYPFDFTYVCPTELIAFSEKTP